MTRLVSFLPFALAAQLAICSGNAISPHIVGGQAADIEQYPYQVSVRLDTFILLHICGGSIYAPTVIVTAAHCIRGRFASYIRIVAGSSIITNFSEQGILAKKLIYHSAYNKKTHENDVGLIILHEPLIYSATIQPIPLATTYPKHGTKAVVSGWGTREEGADTLPENLHAVKVHIIDQNHCGTLYKTKKYTITEEMLCAGIDEGGKDACQGDSGGPLVVDGILVGIVSWGEGCAREGFPGVYSSVAYHFDWIRQQTLPYL